ncbi:MAG: 50S ribosomal protein L3 [Candidatus Omnitrophota bacterium]|nr:MAG: 50S ribosomal protein L3 [Candidatus Omnitrophota bacterium]
MPIGLLGRKLGMTQIVNEQGNFVPVTVLEAGPCPVVQIKNKEKDGYSALQLGFGEKNKNINKPLRGHFEKRAIKPSQFLRELRIEPSQEEKFKEGDVLKVDIFQVGEYVDVSGVSKGKGFQGGVKRWGWRGGPKTHGSMSHRRIGSIGASSDPSRVFKGHHMPGRTGGQRVTVKNLRVMKVDVENNLLCVKGSVPGHRNALLLIKKK